MRRRLRKQGLAYALGVVTALAGFTVGTAWAGHKAGDNTIRACANKSSGVMTLLATGSCKSSETLVEWSITGPQGPQGIQGPKGDTGDRGPKGDAGTINRAVSPNGVFTVTLGNAGILLKGPRGSVKVDFQGVRLSTVGGTP
jgi:hypothetical protein